MTVKHTHIMYVRGMDFYRNVSLNVVSLFSLFDEISSPTLEKIRKPCNLISYFNSDYKNLIKKVSINIFNFELCQLYVFTKIITFRFMKRGD